VISDDRTHPALVSDADFLSVQRITALAVPADGRVHRYQLTGLLVCGLCGRRLEGHWVNQRPGYRCRHGHTTAQSADAERPRWVYWAQARILEDILAAKNKDLADLANAGDLAACLRAREAQIICRPDTVVLAPPVADDAEQEVRPADEVLVNGQLVLPMPTASSRPPTQTIPRPRRADAKPPSRSYRM
jgi:recombinase-like zinc beta ribbon protein